MAFLELIDVNKSFGLTPAVKSFNLQVERGEFISFLGPSGCGKTTTLRMIAGFELPSTGTIRINNADITYTPPNKRNVGMVFQSYALFPNMTVAENIGFGLKLAKKSGAEVKRQVNEMLALIHMQGFGNRYPYQLSGGQQQRVALTRALAIQPQVLLLDEPLSALDAQIRESLRDEIRRIQRQFGITTIYVTHDQEEALALSDRIVVMRAGNVEQVGPPAQIYNVPATRFVADFVGTLNVLSATVVDPASGATTIAGRDVMVGHSLGQSSGKAIALALRPESLQLGEGGGANSLTGQVQNVVFLGSIVRVSVNLVATPSSLLLVDLFNTHHLILPQIDSNVTVSFPPEACLVLDDSSEL